MVSVKKRNGPQGNGSSPDIQGNANVRRRKRIGSMEEFGPAFCQNRDFFGQYDIKTTF